MGAPDPLSPDESAIDCLGGRDFFKRGEIHLGGVGATGSLGKLRGIRSEWPRFLDVIGSALLDLVGLIRFGGTSSPLEADWLR